MKTLTASCVVALGMLVGCGAPMEEEEVGSTSEALTTTPTQHVVLLSGGFGTCEPDGARGVLPSEFGGVLSDIQTRSGKEPIVVRTCFGGAFQANRFDYVVMHGGMMMRGGGTTVAALEAMIRQYLAADLPSRFDAYGHSHGGWLVGRVVQDLGPGTADSFTLNVMLSDPISRTMCTPAAVISGIDRSECARFPADLSTSTIRANTKGWLGVAFQTDDWLHSAPIWGVDALPLSPGLRVGIAARNHRALYTMPIAWARSHFVY